MTSSRPQADVPTGVIFDFDHVIRFWDDEELNRRAAQVGIAEGEVIRRGFSGLVGEEVLTGKVTWEQWFATLKRWFTNELGGQVEPFFEWWRDDRGFVITEMVELVRTLRKSVRVGLLSNATTRLECELKVLGLDGEFDSVTNTARIGVRKPYAEAFTTAAQQLGRAPAQCAFVDDLAENIAGAQAVGMRAKQHTDPASTRAFLSGLGLEVSAGA